MNLILFHPEELGKPLLKRDERAIHLIKVLHKKIGDKFDAGVVGGRMGFGRIESIGIDGSIAFSIDLFEDPSPVPPIRVCVGFPRPIQLRRLLRDLSCLGVSSIDLVGTELGEKSYRDTTLLSDGGAYTSLIEGAAQARDTRIPKLVSYDSLESWLEERPWTPNPRLLVAMDNVRPVMPFVSIPAPSSVPRILPEIVLAIGSERGWSDRERKALEFAGFIRTSMGKRALRTEVACIAAVVLALEKIGELR